MKRLLVTRTDRLGDVLLTLPTLQYLRKALPDWQMDFICRGGLKEILDSFLTKNNIRLRSVEALETLSYFQDPPDAALFLFCPSPWLRIAKKKEIPYRVGPYSKLWSFLTLTHGLRQKRSQGKKNEAEYNLDLAKLLTKQLGKEIEPEEFRIELPKDEHFERKAEFALKNCGLESEDFIVVHPGMGGSALNLSPQTYVRLIDYFQTQTQKPVILSVGPLQYDQEWAQSILRKIQIPTITNHSVGVLMELFRKASLVVAPSTGPLHLAHYVGTQTIGLYPPLAHQSAMRWAPWGGSGLSLALEAPFIEPVEKSMDEAPWIELLGPRLQALCSSP